MDPQQPMGHNPYDFIINPQTPVKHPLSGKLPDFSSNPILAKYFVVIGGFIVILIFIGLIILIHDISKPNVAALIDLTAQQQEIVRVANLGQEDVTQTANQNLAIDTSLTIQTQQRQLISLLAQYGTVVSQKQLLMDMNGNTTEELNNAMNNSTVDVVFAQVMQNELQAYLNSLSQLSNTAPTRAERILTENDYLQAKLLINQVPSSSSLQN